MRALAGAMRHLAESLQDADRKRRQSRTNTSGRAGGHVRRDPAKCFVLFSALGDARVRWCVLGAAGRFSTKLLPRASEERRRRSVIAEQAGVQPSEKSAIQNKPRAAQDEAFKIEGGFGGDNGSSSSKSG